MKNYIPFLTILFVMLCLVMVAPSLLHAQTPPPFLAPPDQAPIDGGLGLLAAAGGAYAWKKLRKKES